MDNAESKYHVIRSWWLSSGVASEKGIFGLSEWLDFWHFRYRQWGGHILFVSTYQKIISISFIFLPLLYVSYIFLVLIFVCCS